MINNATLRFALAPTKCFGQELHECVAESDFMGFQLSSMYAPYIERLLITKLTQRFLGPGKISVWGDYYGSTDKRLVIWEAATATFAARICVTTNYEEPVECWQGTCLPGSKQGRRRKKENIPNLKTENSVQRWFCVQSVQFKAKCCRRKRDNEKSHVEKVFADALVLAENETQVPIAGVLSASQCLYCLKCQCQCSRRWYNYEFQKNINQLLSWNDRRTVSQSSCSKCFRGDNGWWN